MAGWWRGRGGAALLLAAAVQLGCGAAPEDADAGGEDVERSQLELSEAGRLRVAQFNPFHGGRYPKYAFQKGSLSGQPETYETAKAFAHDLNAKYPDVAVIGMQEMDREADAQQMQQALGPSWKYLRYGAAKYDGALTKATQEAIFWRDDLVQLLDDLGTRRVQKYLQKGAVDDLADAGKSLASLDPVDVRFGGAVFLKRNTNRVFGFFTGKLTPRHQYAASSTTKHLDTLDDGDKAVEVARLAKWIDSSMADYPYATRIVAVDMNAGFQSSPWKRMRQTFFDFADPVATWQEPAGQGGDWHRYDYLWWDFDAGARRQDGFYADPKTMGKTGSDHKAVIADVYVRDLWETLPGHACDVRCCTGELFRVNAGTAAQCRDLWTVCRGHGYSKAIRFNGDLLFSKQTCGG